MSSLKSIYELIKSDFCDILDYKIRGNTLEVLTGIPTMSGSTVSVFVSFDGEKYVASDGGWIDSDEYEVYINYENDLIDQVTNQYINYFEVKQTRSKDGQLYYYKTCRELEIVSAIVDDVGHFISMMINLYATNFAETEKESVERKLFQTTINENLRKFYGPKNVRTNHAITIKNEQVIRLNAFVTTRTNQYSIYNCLMYVTGNRPDMFIKDLARATINFKVIEESYLSKQDYQRLAIINTQAPGYQLKRVGVYVDELAAYSDQRLIMVNNNNIYQAISEAMPVGIGFNKTEK